MDPITVQVESDQKEWADDRVDSGEASNRSEVIRRAMWGYMADHGAGNGATASDTRLVAAFKASAKYLFVAALTWLGVTLWFPFSYRTPALALLLASASCVLAAEVLAEYDVRPVAWVKTVVGGEKA